MFDEECSDEEMPATERDLADDAAWKLIQKNTFTRWANEHLKTVNKNIADLESDLGDGLRLVALVEVLSGKKFRRLNKRPNFRTQKLENVSMTLKFLETDEGIKLVNIDSSHIVDGKLKLILGLIWTLILHYSISMPMWEEDEFDDVPKKDMTPKQRLLMWVQNKVPEKPIRNFTTDWNDGTAIGALVDAIAPGLCPDWDTWTPDNKLQNAKEAMDAAEQWLDVPQLIKPEELTDPKVDEMSMMTYLSQFPNAKLKPGAPLRPRTNPSKVRAYGPGIEPKGNSVGANARFTVETFSAGKGKIEIIVLNPNGQPEHCEVVFNNDRNLTYSCSYTPTLEGTYTVTIKFASKEIPKSPFKVNVEGIAGDASKVTASGPGLEKTGNMVGKKTHFKVSTKVAGKGTVDVIILDPHGRKDTVKPKVTLEPDGTTYLVEYTPREEGLHSVNIYFAGTPIPKSPFGVGVAPPCTPSKVYATGRGIQPKGLRVKEVADFKVHIEGAGEGELKVHVIGPGGVEEKVIIKKIDAVTYECVYTPQKNGQYVVSITFGGSGIPKSPFRVNVEKESKSRIRAFGPGLESGVVGYSADFTVETNGETGALGFSIEGPSQAKIDCQDNGNGTADVKYWPTIPGEYAVHVTADEVDIPKSPFMATIKPGLAGVNPAKVKAYGPGLEPTGVEPNKWAEFTVDCREAGSAPLKIQCIDSQYNILDCQTMDNRNGTYTCRYFPTKPDRYTVYVVYADVNVPSSPFRVQVSEPSMPNKVRVYGPGVQPGVKMHEPTYFIVDCKEAGPGDVAIALVDEKGQDVPVHTSDNKDGTFTIQYEPTSVGTYTASVFFADQEIPSSPFKVAVEPHIDISQVYVDRLEPSVFLESPTEFTVDARSIDNIGDGKVKCILTNPQGTKYDTLVDNHKDGTYAVTYTPFEEGLQTLDVTYDGIPVPGSPFKVNIVPGCDPARVKAYGPGLERGVTNEPQKFTVETKGAGQGGLGLAIEGPSEAKMTCRDNRDGSCAIEYLPVKPGDYDITIKFADLQIPGSPFHVHVADKVDSGKVKAFGPGLEPSGVRQGIPAPFTVDCKEAGLAFLDVAVVDKDGHKKPGKIVPRGDGTYDCSYVPEVEGPCKVEIKYGDKHVPKSPFQTKCLPTFDASKVKVSGDGVKPNGVPASLPVNFTVDCKEAGFAPLDVQIQNPKKEPVTPFVRDNGDGTYTCQYAPEEIGKHDVKVKYGGKDVPKSPFSVTTVPTGNADKCKIIEGQQPTVVVGEEAVITISTAEAGPGAIKCRISTPHGSDADIDIEDNGDGTVSIYYTPLDVGDYTIEIKFGGKPIPNGKFKQKSVVPSEDLISPSAANRAHQAPGGFPDFADGYPQESAVKPQRAPGVHSAPGEEPFFAQQAQRPQYAAPDQAFSPLQAPVGYDPYGQPGDYRPVDFCLPIGPNFNRVSAQIVMPSGKIAHPKVEDNKDGTVTIRYTPEENGPHELNVKYNGEPIQGSPFTFHVDSVTTGQVTAYGPGLTHGLSGEPCNFTINTKKAGAGGLALAVEGPSKAEIRCKNNKDGTCDVTYYPTAPGEYKIIVKFDNKDISGSPFKPKITGSRQKASQIQVGSTSDVSLKVDGADISHLKANIKTPSGREQPCHLKRLANGHLGISFTPHEVGQHLVNVFRDGKHIPNSPFKIQVGQNELGNANKVKVYGKGLEEGIAGEDNEFTVDTREAGYGGLSLSIEGPSKADIHCDDNADGTCKVKYKPTEPGNYFVNVKFADQHVPGSPFSVKMGGESHRIRETISHSAKAPQQTNVGSQCELNLKIPGTSPFDMNACVTSPSGETELCEIRDLDDCHYTIKFVPTELGVHTVSVKHQDMHIPGSPFQFTVGPITEGGAHKVHAGGPGLEGCETEQPAYFNIYTREAGAGGLAIAIEGPSKAEIDFKDRKDGSCGVTYTVKEAGEYLISIKFNDDHIPDSPFKVHCSPHDPEAQRLNVIAMQQKGLQVGRPAAFTVDFNGAHGTLSSFIVAPSGAEEEALIQEIDLDKYAVRFVPKENGPHYVHVRFNESEIAGSPFRLMVGKCDADPGMVHASGEGLVKGKTGQPARFIVDTVNAGAGPLSVTIDGPSKVELSCKDIPDGYGFKWVPSAPGDYMITIKYAGNYHIVGSPFKAHVTGEGKPSGDMLQAHLTQDTVAKTATESRIAHLFRTPDSDASKVICKGLGLKKAFVGKSAQFNVDTKDAGTNALLVGILGPGHKLCEEINVKHTGRGQYTVHYLLKEKGDYLLIVKWGEDHVPGSPFAITV